MKAAKSQTTLYKLADKWFSELSETIVLIDPFWFSWLEYRDSNTAIQICLLF